MSIAYKCDRCGEFYENYPRTVCVNICNRDGNGDTMSITTMDLCMQCEAELMYIIEHSPKDSCENEG